GGARGWGREGGAQDGDQAHGEFSSTNPTVRARPQTRSDQDAADRGGDLQHIDQVGQHQGDQHRATPRRQGGDQQHTVVDAEGDDQQGRPAAVEIPHQGKAEDRQVAAHDGQQHGAPVPPEMGVGAFGQGLAGKDQRGGDVVQAGDGQRPDQGGVADLDPAQVNPGEGPETGDVGQHEGRQKRGQDAEPVAASGVQDARDPGDQFDHRQAEDQAVEREEKLERAQNRPSP